jgi:hypothetical protein
VPVYPVDWIKLERICFNEGAVLVCSLPEEGEITEFVAPAEWKFKHSLSDDGEFIHRQIRISGSLVKIIS